MFEITDYILLSRQGALGDWKLLFTQTAMVMGQIALCFPILVAMGHTALQSAERNAWETARTLGAGSFRALIFGKLGTSLFFGLPGNPVAVMVAFYQFVQPALQYLASGRQETPLCFNARCTQPLRKLPGRTEFLRGILKPDGKGDWRVCSASRQGSGILSSMSRANCFIVLTEEQRDIQADDPVLVQPFAGLI